MLKSAFLTGGLWLSAATLAFSADAVGFRETDLDKDGSRPLHVAVWYPVHDPAGPAVTVGENAVFYGIDAIRDAAPTAEVLPLVVLSHGYGGSWRNLNWLASALVEQGYIVAAPDHLGTTTFNKDAGQAATLWERPRDVSRVIDALIADPHLAGRIDATRIAAIGHSLGGWTVSALAGGLFNAQQFEADCRSHSSPRACNLAAELGLRDARLERDMADARIEAFVSLDLGLARGFSPNSLADIHSPFLVIGAGTDIGDMPAKLESGYLAQHLPKASSTSVEIPDAMHFSFMQLCKPDAVELIEEETPGDGIVCKEGGTRRREEIHREVAFLVIGFLATAIPANP